MSKTKFVGLDVHAENHRGRGCGVGRRGEVVGDNPQSRGIDPPAGEETGPRRTSSIGS